MAETSPTVDGAAGQTPLPLSPSRRRVAIGVGGATVLLASMDTYVVVTLFAPMIADLHIGLNDYQQATPIVTFFLLGYVAGMPLLGGLSDRLGRRTVMELCLGGFLIGSIITASALHIGQWLESDKAAYDAVLTGRVIQGLAGGALLPVTMALVADLWSEAKRPAVLGTVGAAQELGSVLGPLYGVGLAGVAIGGEAIGWEGVFWVNVPLTLIGIVAVHFTLPRKAVFAAHGIRTGKVDVVGGLLVAGGLAMLTLGLNNQTDPAANLDNTVKQSALPPHGPLYISIGAGLIVLFAIWEFFARTKLVNLSGSRKGPFFAVLGSNLIAGSALMITLFDIQVLAYGVEEADTTEAALLLVKFLVALPVGALLGGYLSPRAGLRAVTIAGFVLAGFAYWLVSTWPITILDEHYHLAGLAIPRMDTDLALAGLGLGLVIAPLSAAILRVVPESQHGVASASMVVARTMGMLVGFATLSAYGLYRLSALVDQVWAERGGRPTGNVFSTDQLVLANEVTKEALLRQYHEIFVATAILCIVAAVIGFAIITKRSDEQIAQERATAA